MGQEIYAIRTSGNGPHARYEAHLCSGRQWHDSPVRVYLEFEIPKFERMANPIDQKFERFEIPIEPKAFIDMACAMMKADPQEAIRAFGKALQNVQISMPDGK
jgi:hypothetical protein